MGMYAPACGLSAVHMSWTAHEYLYQVLLLNKTLLPSSAKVGVDDSGMPSHSVEACVVVDENALSRLIKFSGKHAICSPQKC